MELCDFFFQKTNEHVKVSAHSVDRVIGNLQLVIFRKFNVACYQVINFKGTIPIIVDLFYKLTY